MAALDRFHCNLKRHCSHSGAQKKGEEIRGGFMGTNYTG